MQMTSLTEHLLKLRVWSLSRHGCPPESYAGILAADNEQVQQEAVRLLKKEHEVLLWLETVLASRSSFGLAQGTCDKLSASVHLIVSIPCRLMMDVFEAGGYKTASVAGLHLLNCLLCTFPDNKIVEDVHNDIRRDGKFQRNTKQTNESIQDVTCSSQVFESRGIQQVKISRDEFVGDLGRYKSEKMWVQIKYSQNASGMAATYGKENLRHTVGRKPSKRSCGRAMTDLRQASKSGTGCSTNWRHGRRS